MAVPDKDNPPRFGDCSYRRHAWRVRADGPDGTGSLAIEAPIPSEDRRASRE